MLPISCRLWLLDRAFTTLSPTEGATVVAALLALKDKFKRTDLQAVTLVQSDAIAGLTINEGQSFRSIYDNELISLVSTDLCMPRSQVWEH